MTKTTTAKAITTPPTAPTHALTDEDKRLIRDFLDESLSIFDLCDQHTLSIPQLRAFAAREDVREAIEALAELSEARAEAITNTNADTRARTLAALLTDPRATPETKRRAASHPSPRQGQAVGSRSSRTPTRPRHQKHPAHPKQDRHNSPTPRPHHHPVIPPATPPRPRPETVGPLAVSRGQAVAARLQTLARVRAHDLCRRCFLVPLDLRGSSVLKPGERGWSRSTRLNPPHPVCCLRKQTDLSHPPGGEVGRNTCRLPSLSPRGGRGWLTSIPKSAG